ncbi:hypothetical protein SAY86_001106 [Trapa natans]|uniref:RRM domain-containing protein n=1 Tax=Trapa natans TaxID=22666 RepID=A0AAN7M506_TRANT|nr:hypothetical protein SAY86_001106 [Trapa natans]
MGKQKKEKEPEAVYAADNPKGKDDSAKPDILGALFGDVTEQDLACSIFSDNNPFKRKHDESKQGSGDSAMVAVKKRKFNRDSVDGDVSETVKSKKEKRKDASSADSLSKKTLKKLRERDEPVPSYSDAVEVDIAKPSQSGLQSDGAFDNDEQIGRSVGSEDRKSNGKNKKRNKRKRDELERAYETIKYGPSVAEGEERVMKDGEGKKATGKRKKADNIADMMVTKEEGFDDEDKLLRTIFVGNLPLKTKKKALLKEFSKFGEIESLRIRSVPILDTKVPRRGAIITKKINDAVDSIHAYIVFKSEESAKASFAHNMAVVGGKHIRVDRACPPRKKLKGDHAPVYDNKRTVFVGNLPFDVQDEEIYRMFASINNLESTIEAVRVIRDPHSSLGKGIAYVLFKTMEAANLVVKKRGLKLRDRQLRVFHAKPDYTQSTRSHPSPAGSGDLHSKRKAMDSDTPDTKKRLRKSDLSYQGLHGKKSSSALKKPGRKSMEAVQPGKGRTRRGSAGKERTNKRPAVAARKARESGSLAKQTEKKRKMGSRTPESLEQIKRRRVLKKF